MIEIVSSQQVYSLMPPERATILTQERYHALVSELVQGMGRDEKLKAYHEKKVKQQFGDSLESLREIAELSVLQDYLVFEDEKRESIKSAAYTIRPYEADNLAIEILGDCIRSDDRVISAWRKRKWYDKR